MNKIFDRFRRRLMIEAIGKASIVGALIGASCELVFMVVMHLISCDPGWLWIGAVFGIPFLLGWEERFSFRSRVFSLLPT